MSKKVEAKTKKATQASAKKSGGLFTETETQPETTNAAEEAERKKALAKQDKHLLEEASNA
jgi:hypothetical protein